VRISSERKTSPQATWQKPGIDPRIFPWVPLPEPGGPKIKKERYFISQKMLEMSRIRKRNFIYY
jgi:hypothetical protein